MHELLVRDQDLGMPPSVTSAISIPTERISIREIIRSRVYQQVQDRNRDLRNATPLHSPSETELTLNGPKRVKEIDWQNQFTLAIEAFNANRLIVLVDDLQAESLDQQVDVIHSQTVVTFLRLVPLVGG